MKVINYPGSKWKLGKQIINLFPNHHSYLEPYFGSGAILFSKLKSNIETINDKDDNVVNLFNCIKMDAEKLAKLIYLTPYSKTAYENAFTSYRKGLDDPFEKALAFAITCNMSHGFRANNVKVGFKIDVQGRERAYAVKTWNDLPSQLTDVATRLKEVQIENRPAENLIKRFNHSNVLMYLDPPYILETRFGKQYNHELEKNEHEQLLNLICNSKAKIIISGYESEIYNEYLQNWHKAVFIAYSQNNKKKKEVLWANFELNSISHKQIEFSI